jgi:hypothetical protein
MGYTFNGTTKRIILTSGTTSVDLQDLYSRWVDWVIAGNARFFQAFRVSGGDPDGEGGFTGRYIFIMNGWSIIPQSANHTLTLTGNLFRDPDDSSGTALVQPVSGYTVNVILSRSSLAQGVSTSGGEFTSGDRSLLTSLSTQLAELYRRQGMQVGITATVKDALTGTPGSLVTSDSTINQTLTKNGDGSVTINRN